MVNAAFISVHESARPQLKPREQKSFSGKEVDRGGAGTVSSNIENTQVYNATMRGRKV